MVDRPAHDPVDPHQPEDDDARDRSAAAAPLDATRVLAAALDGVRGDAGPIPWQALVVALQHRAGELARTRASAWRLAAGSVVPLALWTDAAWAEARRAALLADGFPGPAADRAVAVVAVDLLRTCPTAGTGSAEDATPLPGHPVLERLRPHLSADAPARPGSADGLLARVLDLRG